MINQNVNTKDTDNRTINKNESNRYTQRDNTNMSDITTKSGSSQSNRGGETQNSSYINLHGEQSGSASSVNTNRGYQEENLNTRQKINDDISHDKNMNYHQNEQYGQIGMQVGVESEVNNSSWKEGGSELHTSGGPAEGTVWGRNQNQTWDVDVYNDNAEYNMYSVGGDAHSDRTKVNAGIQSNNQIGSVAGGANYNEDYNRAYTNNIDANHQKMDNRTIKNNSQYRDEQNMNGNSGSQSSYNDYSNNRYQDESKRNQNIDFASDIQTNTGSQYTNDGIQTHSYNNDSRDTVINKANNRLQTTTENKVITYDEVAENYSIVIGTVEVSDVQVRNAISKAVRDAIYGNTGLMTTLNNGKKLKIKTGF